MGILSDLEIKRAYISGEINIEPFKDCKLNPNGYNLSLNEKLLVYTDDELDMRKPNPTKEIIIPPEGLVLQPGVLYLGKTNEYTETCAKYVPMLEGRSSTGRLGIDVHICAGAGDAGYKGNWTLEIRVVKPVRIYANVDVCQIMYHEVCGEVANPYNGKYQGKTDVNASEIFKDEVFINSLYPITITSNTPLNTNNINYKDNIVSENDVKDAIFLCNRPEPIKTVRNPCGIQLIQLPKPQECNEELIKIDNFYLKDEFKNSIFVVKHNNSVDSSPSNVIKESLDGLSVLLQAVNESMDKYCKEYYKKYNIINGTENDKSNIVCKK